VDYQGETVVRTRRQYVDIPAIGQTDQSPLSLHEERLARHLPRALGAVDD